MLNKLSIENSLDSHWATPIYSDTLFLSTLLISNGLVGRFPNVRFKLAASETQQLTQNQIAGSEQTLNSSKLNASFVITKPNTWHWRAHLEWPSTTSPQTSSSLHRSFIQSHSIYLADRLRWFARFKANNFTDDHSITNYLWDYLSSSSLSIVIRAPPRGEIGKAHSLGWKLGLPWKGT